MFAGRKAFAVKFLLKQKTYKHQLFSECVHEHQKEAPSPAVTRTTAAAGGSMGGARGKVAELTVNMVVDGEKFASKVVNIVDEKEGLRAREAAYGQA